MASRFAATPGTLAERLGHGPEDRLLIVSCDDLGSSHSANVAIFRSMAHGVASSATLMVPCPWAREAARMFQDFPIGVHLTLTSEHRGYRWRGLTNGASLHDEEGFLTAAAEVALERVVAPEARKECRAQIETALSWGVDVTHLDAHMNIMQARSDLYEIYLDLADKFRQAHQLPRSPRAPARRLIFKPGSIGDSVPRCAQSYLLPLTQQLLPNTGDLRLQCDPAD